MTTEPHSPPNPPPVMKNPRPPPRPTGLQPGLLAQVPGELVTKATPGPAPHSMNSETHLAPALTNPDLKTNRSFLPQPRECDAKENIPAQASGAGEAGASVPGILLRPFSHNIRPLLNLGPSRPGRRMSRLVC